MRIYLTHCTGIKNEKLIASNKKVLPETLYTSVLTQRFISKCKAERVKWAIFSDQYGIWFPEVKHKWYEKHPNTVSEEEFAELLAGFDKNLAEFSEIWFYNHPSWFHSLYQRIIRESTLNQRIRTFSHLKDIYYDH